MSSASSALTILAGGDVAPLVQPVDRCAELVQPILDTVDFRFVQCERTYSTRGAFPDWQTVPTGTWSRLDPEFATVFKAARADVISLASNHALDWGFEALFDTMDLFNSSGMQTVGAGHNQDEAHQPVILEKNGVRVAILAYCSVVRDGWAAHGNHPGLASVRVKTWYENIDFQPGCPPLIRSEALPDDVARMTEDITRAKESAHAVVVAMHWGIRHVPKVLAEYQVPVAHAAMDAGADVIVGHHPHVPKAIETYGDSTCFYSIGNFMTTGSQSEPTGARWNLFWYEPHEEGSLYGFPEHCRKAVLPKLAFSSRGVERIALVPVFMNNLAQPEPLKSGDPRFAEALQHLEWLSDQFPHDFTVEGDEIVVSHAPAHGS